MPEGEAVDALHKLDGVSGVAAAQAMKEAFGRSDDEVGGVLVVVKGTEADVVLATVFFQLDAARANKGDKIDLFLEAADFGFWDSGHVKKWSSLILGFYLHVSYTDSLLLARGLYGMIVIMTLMARPSKTEQPEYGAHLASLRHRVSLSQQQVADQVGVRQATVAAWERSATPPRGEFLVPLSKALGVTLEELLQADRKKTAKHRGPSSKLEKLVEEVSHLPRRRQQRIASLLEAMVAEEAKVS